MSQAHDAHAKDAHAAHDAHDAHAFDGEPVKDLPPDEPRTPGWVPAVGVIFFLVAGIALLASGGSEASSDAKAPAFAAPEGRAAQVRPIILPPNAPAPGANPAPGPAGLAPITKLTPEQAKALQQRIEDARARQAAQQGGAPAPGGAAPGEQPPPSRPARPAPPPPAPGGDEP